MINVNKTKESIQNVLIFITDAIALIMSYYMSGFIWLMGIRNNTFPYIMSVLNGNIITIIIAVLIAALFCNIKGDVLNRGKFEELVSVIKKSLISSAVIAVYELLSKTVQGVPRSVYVITFFMGTVLMFLLRLLVKVYMKYRNGGKRANSILVVTIKDRAKDTLTKAVARNDWMRRIDGIVITDEDMTGQSIEGFPVVANVHSMMRYIKNEIVDEVFIDATPYLNTYQLTPKEFAMKMILDIYETTGITATAGIGTNLYLAKVAMDIVAKHKDPDENGVRVAALNEYRYRKLLWNHKPLTDFWRVGKGYEKRLHKLGIDTMGKLCAFSLEHEDVLFKTFGVNAELLIDHAWGYEPCTIEDIKAYKPEKNSIGSGQVLSCGYEKEKAKILVKEMVESLALSLVDKHLVTNKVVLTIGYEVNEDYTGETIIDFYGRVLPKSLHKIVHLPQKTNANSIMIQNILDVYDQYVDSSLLVRRINVAAVEVIDEKNRGFEQMDLFSNVDEEELKKENDLQKVTLKIKNKYGKNSILKGTDFEKGAKAKERNAQIGGHKA